METKKLIGSAIGIAISVAVLYATVYFVSKAWAKGQK
jgi:hypothetical protein